MPLVKDWEERRGFQRERDGHCTYNTATFPLSVFPHRVGTVALCECRGPFCSVQMSLNILWLLSTHQAPHFSLVSLTQVSKSTLHSNLYQCSA